MTNKINKTWEERFEEKFGKEIVYSNWLDCPCCGRPEHRIKDSDLPINKFWFYKPIIDFIRQELSQARKEGMIEGYSKGHNEGYLERSKDLPASYQKGKKEGIEESIKVVNEKVKWAKGANPEEVYEELLSLIKSKKK